MKAKTGLFVRIQAPVLELLHETIRGMKMNVPAGEQQPTLGLLIERCVLEVLAPGVEPTALAAYTRELAAALARRSSAKGAKP